MRETGRERDRERRGREGGREGGRGRERERKRVRVKHITYILYISDEYPHPLFEWMNKQWTDHCK